MRFFIYFLLFLSLYSSVGASENNLMKFTLEKVIRVDIFKVKLGDTDHYLYCKDFSKFLEYKNALSDLEKKMPKTIIANFKTPYNYSEKIIIVEDVCYESNVNYKDGSMTVCVSLKEIFENKGNAQKDYLKNVKISEVYSTVQLDTNVKFSVIKELDKNLYLGKIEDVEKVLYFEKSKLEIGKEVNLCCILPLKGFIIYPVSVEYE
jgi:hypothetical protein